MLKMIMKNRLSAVSALALTLAGSGAAFASSDGGLAGLSRDGSVYLETSRNWALRTLDSEGETVRLVSTITGQVTEIPIPSTAYSVNATLSADGKTVVGDYYVDGVRIGFSWTAKDGFVSHESSASFTRILGVSDNGILAGYTSDFNTNTAAVWIDGERRDAPSSPDYNDTSAEAISRDGSTVVGGFTASSGYSSAMIWNLSTDEIRNIGGLNSPYQSSYATLVSNNGSVVAGYGYDSSWDPHVFRWTSANGMQDIGGLTSSNSSYSPYMYLAAMSDDGDVLVGEGLTDSGYYHAYRYVASASANNLADLGTLGGNTSSAKDVSADGKYVVGQAEDAGLINHGFRWTEETGMQSIEAWMEESGVTFNYNTYSANYISDDGKVVVGMTDDDAVYVARSGGIIKEEEFFPTVVQVGSSTVQNSVSSANTIMFGAQGNPMRNLLGAGERSAWGTVDAGYDNSDISKGGLALGEFGLGYGIFDGVTARFSVGGTYTKQDLDASGWVKQKGYYLSPEVSADLGSNLYLTVGGYFSRTNIDTSRGYLNGSTQDYSNGSTNADTWGAKVRFDWLNAANFANTDITPYAGLSYARTTVDAYTENDGSFPVSYDETSDHSTIARIGADFVRPMSDTVRLLAKTEVSYQFEDHAAATSGAIVGINNFSIEGQDLKQFWVRGGIGAEVDIAGGTASFMVNATTQGQDPTVWLRSNYTVKF